MPMMADRRGLFLSVMNPTGMPAAYMPRFADVPCHGEKVVGAENRGCSYDDIALCCRQLELIGKLWSPCPVCVLELSAIHSSGRAGEIHWFRRQAQWQSRRRRRLCASSCGRWWFRRALSSGRWVLWGLGNHRAWRYGEGRWWTVEAGVVDDDDKEDGDGDEMHSNEDKTTTEAKQSAWPTRRQHCSATMYPIPNQWPW